MERKVFVLYFIVYVYVLYNFCFIISVCVCVGIRVRVCLRNMRVYRQHLHKCGNSQNTNPKKTFVTFCETFYIHIQYICCAGRCLWALQWGPVGERDALRLTAHGSWGRPERESQVWYVCVRVWARAVVVALLTQAWLDREARPARGA